MLEAERVTDSAAYHGEGPFWDDRAQRLLFLDVLAGDVLSFDQRGFLTRFPTPSPVVSVIRHRTFDGFVIATGNGLIAADAELAAFASMVDISVDPTCRINDGGCDPMGGFVVGTMACDERPSGGVVYRVAPDLDVTEITSPVSISNGIHWSADGTHAYYVDSPTRRIDVFDVDCETGMWSNRRPHLQVEPRGVPDGMAIDEEDGLWIAIWGAGRVNHYDSSGHLVESIAVPGVTQVSSCAFGGIARDVLYVTTSRKGLGSRQEPSAGALFAVNTDTRGALLYKFGG